MSFGLPQVLVENANSKSQVYVYGVGRLAQSNDGTFEWFLDDALGSVRQVAAGDGSVLLAQEYDPYGQRLAAAGGGSSGYGYAGEQWDGSTGLVFLRARWYDPRTGRFVSKDPFPGYVSLPQTLNPYAYCLNNPINATDPSGKFVGLLAAIILGGPPAWFVAGAFIVGGITVGVFTAYVLTEIWPEHYPGYTPEKCPGSDKPAPKPQTWPGEGPKPSNPSSGRDPQRSPKPPLEPVPLGPDVSSNPQPQGEPKPWPESTPSPKPTGTPTPTPVVKTIIELGSGDFTNLSRIVDNNPGARVIGIEHPEMQELLSYALDGSLKDPEWQAMAQGYNRAIAKGAEVYFMDFGRGLPFKADEIISIAPNPSSAIDVVSAIRSSIKPGGHVYVAGVVGESTATTIGYGLGGVQPVRGISRYPSPRFLGTGNYAEILDFVVP